ncbi:MAG: acetyl-CoA carboxylase [Burkholderiaceae bacterium]|jgi:acetyl-CoA carboxylase biotin carboxyl carrier protein
MPQHELQSPLPGTFYRRPSPDAPAFKEVGSTVKEGEVVALIEVMKQFSEVQADAAGTITAFLVEDAEAVEPGQALLRIETA